MSPRHLIHSVLVLFLFLTHAETVADEFRLMAWNVESNRPGTLPVSDPDTIAAELTQLMQDSKTRSQVIVLSEVDPRTVPQYKDAIAKGLGAEVDYLSSASGGFQDSDLLVVAVDRSRFEIEEAIEIHRYGGIIGNMNIEDNQERDYGALRARSPLAVKLRDKTNQKEFWVIANHLARGEADLRTQQANMLAKWAEDHSEPIIAAGDFNFDYDFKAQQGNEGFDAMMKSGVWEWLKPDPLVDTNWSDDRTIIDRRVDRYPDSMLDFVFVANAAREWHGVADVVVRPGDFPDSDATSDHRPVIADFSTTK